MNALNNLKVGTKIIMLVAVLLCCMAIISAISIFEMRKMDEQSNLMYGNNLLGLQAAKEANIQLLNVSRGLRNIALVSPEARPQYIIDYNGFVDRAFAEMNTVKGLLLTADGLAVLEKARKAFEDYLPVGQSFIDRVGGFDLQQIVAELVGMREVANAADNYMTQLVGMLTDAAHNRNDTISNLGQIAQLINLIGLAAGLLLGALLGLLIKRAIANPLVEIAGKAEQVAAGDLSQDFSMQRRDELGSLSAALAQMVANLRERIAEAEQKSREATEQSRAAAAATAEANLAKDKAEQGQVAIMQAAENVEQVVNRLSAATEELSAQVEQSSRGMDMQRDRISVSATAMEEMNSTVLEVARNAGIASEGSERARHKASQGENVVRQSVAAINAVQSDTQELKRNMEGLGHQAEAIGAIMTVISDIADQTNLLALNAAIEAARAGEAGRGFAVVADEVRKLAEKTMTATKEVGDAIKGIQDGTKLSISTVERTTGNLDSTTDLVKNSGAALADIVQEVVLTADQVRSIATAAEEQSAASDEITHSLDEINRMASETATAMQQSTYAVAELAQQTQELQRLVNNLRHA